jgi:DNA-binding SARP family transcriptional activator
MKRISQTHKTTNRTTANAALFDLPGQPGFLHDAVLKILKPSQGIVVSDDPGFFRDQPESQRMSFVAAGLDGVLVNHDEVFSKLKLKTKSAIIGIGIVVDMRWAVSNEEALISLEQWGGVAERLCSELGIPVISVYDQELMIEEHMQAALRVHSQFIAPSGIYENPYWLPAELLGSASVAEQLGFMLGRVVPDHKGSQRSSKSGDMHARGATPSWIAKRNTILGASAVATRWQIHCFGQLRIFVGGQSINWRIAGSTPKKTQTLFAYLLQCGEKGAHCEQISELLWPEEEIDGTKRARLHHTIAMLRKTLGRPQSIIRTGDYYRLNTPICSWIDINTFEQLCRRAMALFKKGELESAVLFYVAADKLYVGDLFETLPREYIESENENWCMPRRMWLREMALKLQNDFTSLLLKMGRTREALDHCLKALAIDPASEGANEAAMKIFALQGRDEAIHRQYKQYQQAVKALGETESSELRTRYRALISKEKPKNAD